ncbi:MAG: alpha/beta-hydrolase family protein [Acidimicrobiia bacterium]
MIEQLRAFDTSDLVKKRLPPVMSAPASTPGMLTGVVFAALTNFPSMIPKNGLVQGVVLGITFAIGYGFGAALHWLWRFLELPSPQGRVWRSLAWIWYLLLPALLLFSAWHYVGWQNTARAAFGMETISPLVWLVVVPVAAAVTLLVFIVARSLRKLFNLIVHWFDQHLPRRLALLVGGVAFFGMMWGLWSGVMVDAFFAAANQILAPLDASTDDGIIQPQSANRSGSPASQVDWETLGRQGRNFVATGPSESDLNQFHGGGALEPIRVYVGLNSAETVAERARLVLDELIRTDAFDRNVLVLATTTGSGIVESNAIDALEYVTKGDVAVASVQYSYLSSVLSLLADADEVRQASRVVFDEIHSHWSGLHEDSRPELYLYGLSLGAYGVESILTSIAIINAPIDGALMVGPPFISGLWSQLVADRDPGSTPATPVYEEGRTVRFTNETSAVSLPKGEWGDTRILYLQNASDPVVFFTPSLLFDQPDWLRDGQRSADIVEGFVWIPLVTMWQVLMDGAAAGSVPEGYGHLYSKQANADAWIAVIDPEGWSDTETDRLKEHLTALGPAE